MREIIQLDVVRQILTDYSDDIPLHFFLKGFYKKHRQFGSRDRRFYSEVVYKYFRCKTFFEKLPFEEKLCYSGFLTSPGPNDFYKYLFRLRNLTLPLYENWDKTQPEKISLLLDAKIISWENYFPAKQLIDKEINMQQFLISHLSQPKFYIRIREKNINDTIQKLREQNIEFENSNETFAFASQTDVTKYLPEQTYEVQDLSSQQTINLFKIEGQETIWDCCCGGGGKSLMLMDKYPEINLYCTDNRPTILQNLKERFTKIDFRPKGISVYDAVKKRGELIFNDHIIPEEFFDIIIADVPCSGSGTWGRNPERLNQFKEEEIEMYRGLQTGIIKNTLKYLKAGGKLIYITCSVYASENSNNINLFENLGLKITEQNYFIGYDKNADTLYGAILLKI